LALAAAPALADADEAPFPGRSTRTFCEVQLVHTIPLPAGASLRQLGILSWDVGWVRVGDRVYYFDHRGKLRGNRTVPAQAAPHMLGIPSTPNGSLLVLKEVGAKTRVQVLEENPRLNREFEVDRASVVITQYSELALAGRDKAWIQWSRSDRRISVDLPVPRLEAVQACLLNDYAKQRELVYVAEDRKHLVVLGLEGNAAPAPGEHLLLELPAPVTRPASRWRIRSLSGVSPKRVVMLDGPEGVFVLRDETLKAFRLHGDGWVHGHLDLTGSLAVIVSGSGRTGIGQGVKAVFLPGPHDKGSSCWRKHVFPNKRAEDFDLLQPIRNGLLTKPKGVDTLYLWRVSR
jgi:hypothetical protein